MTDMLEDKHFIDWESAIFGYGYGTGEPHTIAAIKLFLGTCPAEGCYDYEKLEDKLGTTTAWLLINIFCQNAIIEYGTSPRSGWLDKRGLLLKQYLDTKGLDDLLELVNTDENYDYCYPKYCTCEGSKCNNPLFN
jgi:hypothetical protein